MFASDLIGQGLIDKLSAVFASIYVLNILNDFGLNRRYIDNLMTQRLFIGFFLSLVSLFIYSKFDKIFFKDLFGIEFVGSH